MTDLLLSTITTVRISGEIDIATCAAMGNAMSTVLYGGPVDLIADMSAVSFMDASGIRVLLAARQLAAETGSTLALRAPSQAVRRLLDILHLTEMFTFVR